MLFQMGLQLVRREHLRQKHQRAHQQQQDVDGNGATLLCWCFTSVLLAHHQQQDVDGNEQVCGTSHAEPDQEVHGEEEGAAAKGAGGAARRPPLTHTRKAP